MIPIPPQAEPELVVSSSEANTKEAQQQDDTSPWLISFSSDDSSMSSDDETDSSQWYARNDIAFTDPREMRKYILGQTRLGLDMVNALQAAGANKKKVDVTGKRRERKSVLPQEIWGQVEEELRQEGIELVNREKEGAAEGRTKATLTYYGTSAMFYNHQVRTKIRMRIRYYLSYVRGEDGTITDVQREGATRNAGFLELKVKSPRAFEENSVDKYRLLVPDAIIAQLVNLDATDVDFRHQLDLIKETIQAELPEQSNLINTMFSVMGRLAQRKPSFLRPSLVITYERSAYKYIEKAYPIPIKEAESKKRSRFLRKSGNKKMPKLFPRWGRRSTPKDTHLDSSDNTETASLTHSLDASLVTRNVEHHDIEYQFTIDRNVRAHYPLLPVEGAAQMPIAEHFDLQNRTELMRYPAEARVIEFKEPLVVAELPRNDRSNDHNTLVEVLVAKMEKLIMWGDYDENIGKYGNLRSRIMQEHKTNRIKNELIEIDFSGTGKYNNKNDQTSMSDE